MSFTLVRYKDGKEIPVKVSILDAFRRTPPRKPKAVQLEKKAEFLTSSIPNASKPNTKCSPVEKAVAPVPTRKQDTDKDAANAKIHSDDEDENYSAEDDAKIIAMKAIAGTSWNEIKEAIGKQSLSKLKDHYKLHLGPNAEAEQKKLAEKTAKVEKTKAEGLAKKADGGGKKDVEEGEKKVEGHQGRSGCVDRGAENQNTAGGGGGGGGGADAGSKAKVKDKAKAKEVCFRKGQATSFRVR